MVAEPCLVGFFHDRLLRGYVLIEPVGNDRAFGVDQRHLVEIDMVQIPCRRSVPVEDDREGVVLYVSVLVEHLISDVEHDLQIAGGFVLVPSLRASVSPWCVWRTSL